jgi:hypothetical protein
MMLKKSLMMKERQNSISIFEKSYYILYFVVAFVAGIILFPLSFIVSKEQHNFDGYDL